MKSGLEWFGTLRSDTLADEIDGINPDATIPNGESPNGSPPVDDTNRGNVRTIDIEREMRGAYLDYAMSVIVARALPDARDGLKPVHRRILYAMQDLNLEQSKPYKKSARIVGDCLGKYHPHGDLAVYDTLVRMAQSFSLRYPLVDGQGNFGSVDGDSAAAMRYTEVRLAKPAEEMLADLEKQTVKFTPNFDGSLQEPSLLPGKMPNLLVNGSSGIAVGMATNMPPHNLCEVCDAITHYIDNPQCTIQDLMAFVQAPDFPTGALICGRSGVFSAYSTGKGSITVRAKAEIKEVKEKRQQIIVSEIPYQVNKARLIEQIAELVNEKKIEGISDLRDESDREGMRILVELKRDANADVVLNQLYEHTPMQTTFGIINLALVDGQPKVLTLKELIEQFVEHRTLVIIRRCKFELGEAEDRAHILEGLKVALAHIDEVVQTVKRAESPQAAKSALIAGFNLSEKQAQAILDMKLQRLTALERGKMEAEHKELLVTIAHLKTLLSEVKLIHAVIKADLAELRRKFGDARRTQVTEETGDITVEELIPREKVVVTITNSGYIKRMPLTEYETQRRGGRGVIGVEAKEEDFATDMMIANTHDHLLFFTDKGRVHWLKVYRIPEAGRYAAGRAIVNLLELKDEKIRAFIPVSEFREDEYLVICTRDGIVKRSSLSEYANPRRGGIIAVTMREGDDLIDARRTSGNQEIILATRNGMAIRFNENDARSIGRTGMGVIGIRLREGDHVIGMASVEPGDTLLTICENGHGKRTPVDEYRQQSRGGYGVINIQATERNGKVVAVRAVTDDDELMIVNSNGVIIRISVKGISAIGRNTQGVRLMKLAAGERIVAVARIAGEKPVEAPPHPKQEPSPSKRPEAQRGVGEIEIL